MPVPATDLVSILNRLERLERQNRFLKCLGFALVGLAGLGFLVAADNPAAKDKIFSAEKIVLKDHRGKPRLMLATHKDQSGIVFFTSEGQQQAFLVAEPSGVALRFMRPDGLYTSGIGCQMGGVNLVGVTASGRIQSEVNAIMVPGKMLLKDYSFPVSVEEKK